MATCSEPGGPQLFVHGVCSCTGGLLVHGRNITKELDTLRAHSERGDTSSLATSPVIDTKSGLSTSTTSLDITTAVSYNCTVMETPKVVGSIVGDSINMKHRYSVAVSTMHS